MILSPEQRRRESEGILGGEWPHWPILPVVRDEPEPRFGVILWRFEKEEDRPVRVYLKIFFAFTPGASVAENLEGVEVLDYPTLDAFYDDGWRGD